ncbi:hypothetical protein NDS46_30575 (plasmid) [Paenibacillus thiaminolyticus]|uniref:hypothetical protein n=1 Tax=Paenibacillus thiaminolyticus TaxID=49283 RepID=UPI00232B165E|nr:hypothetical protein [Paenibacillus thiaminolyticus]WCF11695.1 hypothetical protein NDS46_30575 [Paenibacillus thiaminolyticus]
MKKEMKLNETVITLKESKQNITSVHINTEDADIYVNGVLVWQRYSDPKFSKVPPIFRKFIADKVDYMDEEKEQVVADLHQKGFKTVATFYFPKNARSSIHVRLDAVTSLEELETEFIKNCINISDSEADTLTAEFKAHWNKIEKAINDAGWKLTFSHSQGDKCWAWWDVVFQQSDWNEEVFMGIWKLFSDFNKRLDEVFKKYHM